MENKENGIAVNWSLKELYTSFESEDFKRDFGNIFNGVTEMKRLSDNFSKTGRKEAIKSYIMFITGFYEGVMKLWDFCEMTLSTDAECTLALKNVEKIEKILTETTEPETRFNDFIKKLTIDELSEIINSDSLLKEHEFFLKETKIKAEYTLSEREERVISKMENTGSSAWIKYQENVMATLMADIELDGEKKRLPFSEIRNLAYEKNRETRIKAYTAEIAACKTAAKACAASLNGIKGEVITVCKLRGYKSPLEMTIINSRLERQVLEALISSLRKNASLFTPYFKRKAEIVGAGKEGLPFYDLFAPVGQTDLCFTYNEAVDYVCECFSHFSDNLANYARKASDRGWIDVYPKEGKRGGAFCQNMHYLKQSRILLNFTGSFNDILTLAHELGHGYHGECLENEAYLNSDYPMPIAETASTLCEKIVVNEALKSSSPAAKTAILENGISSAAQVIVDILSRYIFESRVFEMRKEGSLSVEELCEIMKGAQMEAYGEGLDKEHLHEYMWVVKSHYYSASQNFYNFPYAFGQLFSNGLYSLFLKNGPRFSETFRKMLAASGKNSLKDTALIAGIDISGESFWDFAFDTIKQDIQMFLSMTDNSI